VPILIDASDIPVAVIVVAAEYDPSVLAVSSCVVDPEQLADISICNANFDSDKVGLDSIRFALASATGITGVNRIADLNFNSNGSSATSSALWISMLELTDLQGQSLPYTVDDGVITVLSGSNEPDNSQHHFFIPFISK
jgi:hypothetical protein